MAALALQVLVLAGSASTLAAASGGGDTAPCGDGTFLEVNNGDASSKTVTLTTPGLHQGLAIADQVVVIPAGQRWKIPLPSNLYGQDVSITYSAVTSVTVGVFKIAS